MVQNQQSGYVAGRPVSSPARGNQIYDPFSPTSISSAPQQQGGRPVRKQDADAEYEDLMASVGVRWGHKLQNVGQEEGFKLVFRNTKKKNWDSTAQSKLPCWLEFDGKSPK